MIDIVCRIIGHRRSRLRAELVAGTWRSRCKRCGVRLVRLQPSKWREIEKVDLLALRGELLRHLDQRYAVVDQNCADFRGAFFQRRVARAPERDVFAAHFHGDAEYHR